MIAGVCSRSKINHDFKLNLLCNPNFDNYKNALFSLFAFTYFETMNIA